MEIEKPSGKTVPLRALLAPEEKQQLVEIGEYYGVTLSHAIRQLIRHGHQAMMQKRAERDAA